MSTLNPFRPDVFSLPPEVLSSRGVDVIAITFADDVAWRQRQQRRISRRRVESILRHLSTACPNVERIDFGPENLDDDDDDDDDQKRQDLLASLNLFPKLVSIADGAFRGPLHGVTWTEDFSRVRSLHLNCFVDDLSFLRPLAALQSLRLRIGAAVTDLQPLQESMERLESLSINEVASAEKLDILRLFGSGLKSELGLTGLCLEEQRGGGGFVNAVYPDALKTVWTRCRRMEKMKMLVSFKMSTWSENAFAFAPNSLVELKLRLFFPYKIQVDVKTFADQIVQGFHGKSLHSLEFQSYDAGLSRLYDELLKRCTVPTQAEALLPKVPSRVLRHLDRHVESAGDWEAIESALWSMESLKSLKLTMRMTKEQAERKQSSNSQSSEEKKNFSVEEITVDFLPVEPQRMICCGSGSNKRSRPPSPSSSSSSSIVFFKRRVLPFFPNLSTLRLDNFKTLALGFSDAPSLANLQRLLAPTTTVVFVPGEFQRLVTTSCPRLEEVELGFASGIPLEEVVAVAEMSRLKVGCFQFDGVAAAQNLAPDRNMNILEEQQSFHKKILQDSFPGLEAALLRHHTLAALRLCFDVTPVGGDFGAALKNGVATGVDFERDWDGRMEWRTVNWN